MNFNIKSYKLFNCGIMAFLKKRTYNQTYKNFCLRGENEETNKTILESLFSNLKEVEAVTIDDDKDTYKSAFSKPENYMLPGSPVCTTDVVFDTQHTHNTNCPIETKKPTNIELYTRYNANSFSNLKEPTYYLVWYNIVISTGYRNCKAVCCASISIEVSKIVGSSGFRTCNLQKTTCCETVYSNSIETVDSTRDSIYLDSITNKKEDTSDKASLSSIFTDFYNVLLSLFEEIYPSYIVFGLNNIIIKNTEVDTTKIFKAFFEKIKNQYSFYYKQPNKPIKTDDIQNIQSWLMSPLAEEFTSFLTCNENNLDFLGLLE